VSSAGSSIGLDEIGDKFGADASRAQHWQEEKGNSCANDLRWRGRLETSPTMGGRLRSLS
jgi:hypothetical protein